MKTRCYRIQTGRNCSNNMTFLQSIDIAVGGQFGNEDLLSVGSEDIDDDVFLEVDTDEDDGTLSHPSPSQQNALAAAPSNRLMIANQRRRPSFFELPLPGQREAPCGASLMSFACEPKTDEEHARQKKVQCENTYQMEPPVRFKADPVTAIIRDVLQTHLEDKIYDPIMCASESKMLAQEIKSKVKEMDFKRYKLVALVMIGEKKDQDVRVGSRCVWDTQWDSYSSATYENAHLYAVGTVYAMYYE